VLKSEAKTLNIQPVRKFNKENIISFRIPEVAKVSAKPKLTGIIRISFVVRPHKIENRTG